MNAIFNRKKKAEQGFTLIEILVVIGIIAILAAIVIIAINPARQFAQARNSQRTSNVNAILNAIGQNIADNKGIFDCDDDDILASSSSVTAKTISNSGTDIYNCIVPTYMPALPFDPGNSDTSIFDPGDYPDGTPYVEDGNDYDTGYTVSEDNSRITVCAPGGAEEAIEDSGEICVTR